MAILRAQVVLPYKTGMPEDVVVQTYHFDSSSADLAAAQVIRDHLTELYNVAAAPGTAIAGFLGNALSRSTNAAKIKVYNLADPMPRPPWSFDWTLNPSSSTAFDELPAEVAVVASYYAGRNIKRFRGRTYFGPFHSGVLLDATNDRSRPSVALVDAIRFSLRRLINKPANTQNLAVYSRIDNTARIVDSGWVDDAWDTQRRRGQDASTRFVI